MKSCWLFLLLFFLLLGAVPQAGAQIQQGSVSGTVTGPDGGPVEGTVVTLLDALGVPLRSVTAAEGRFRIPNVAPGTYGLRAGAGPLQAFVQTLTVSGALAVEVELRLSPVLTEQIVVRADESQPGSGTTRITLSGDAVRRSPSRLRSRGLQDVVATAPGWATEDNGLLHARGVDDGFLYVVDGVPFYERIDALFGVAPDPAVIDSINILSGYIPPEFGFKSGGVIEVRTVAGRGDSWMGTLDVGGGSDTTGDVAAVAGGPVSRAAALTLGVTALSSDRFLDPIHPDNFHNEGETVSGGGQAGWSLSPVSELTASAGFGESAYEVPHGAEQEEAGQDQRQEIHQGWQTLSWQRSWSANVVSQVAGYHRSASAALLGSPRDTPLFTDASRDLRRTGALASLTVQPGDRHLLKIGAEAARLRLREDFRLAVTDLEAAREADLNDEVLEHTPEEPFLFHDSAEPALYSFYVQDSIRATERLTLDLGVRGDWSRMLTRASQWSPRAGAAYHWPGTETTLRASFGRFFQPPQPENLLLASSVEARELSPFAGESGAGGAVLHPERQTAFEIGVSQNFARAVRADFSYWRRRSRNVADPNVFFGTTIIFPNTVARGRASGFDLRVEVPRRRGWAGYLSYTNSRVVQTGPITGGLFLEDDVIELGAGEEFTPDHDQRHAGAFGITWDSERGGLSASVTGRYESGTPLEVDEEDLDELMERPGAGLVDFELGRVKPRHAVDVTVSKRFAPVKRIDLTLRLAVLNVTGRRWAYNFGNPFSGTHFGPGRTAQAGIRLAFQ